MSFKYLYLKVLKRRYIRLYLYIFKITCIITIINDSMEFHYIFYISLDILHSQVYKDNSILS